jgi:hypothetical protein
MMGGTQVEDYYHMMEKDLNSLQVMSEMTQCYFKILKS